MKTTTFFATHPVFTCDEFAAFVATHGSGNVNTLTAALRRYTGNGQIMRIRRGLYASMPPGQTPETTDSDPYLVASHLAPDAALAYHTALQFRCWTYTS